MSGEGQTSNDHDDPRTIQFFSVVGHGNFPADKKRQGFENLG